MLEPNHGLCYVVYTEAVTADCRTEQCRGDTASSVAAIR